jgi:hypothetical protein
MRRRVAAIGLACLLGAVGPASAGPPIDAALGDVDGHLIALSDVALARALGVFGFEPSDAPIESRDLDRYIDAQLAVAEASRLAIEVPADDLERAWNAAGGEALAARLDEAGVDRAWARRLFEADRLMQRFVDVRFRAFAFVMDEEVEAALGAGPRDPATRNRTRERLQADMVAQAFATWQRSARARAVIRLAPDAAGPWPVPFSIRGPVGR